MPPSKDLVGQKFGRLTVIKKTSERKNGKVVWLCICDCGNEIKSQTSYLVTGDTSSCGCLKKEINNTNLRDKYNDKRVDGVVKPLFKDKNPRNDSNTGYRGVSRYHTRINKEVRYRAWITVKGKKYYKSGFLTAEEAYEKGRLLLENKHLPKGD